MKNTSGVAIMVEAVEAGNYAARISEDEHGLMLASARRASIAGAINAAVMSLRADEIGQAELDGITHVNMIGRSHCATKLAGWSFERAERLAVKLLAPEGAK